MTHQAPDELWRDFPKSAQEFEAWFATGRGVPGLLDQDPLGRRASVRPLLVEAGARIATSTDVGPVAICMAQMGHMKKLTR